MTPHQLLIDPRTIRPHPDIQATHRACNVCHAVLPLDRYHFHRNYRAYSWAPSYYTRACIPCLGERRKRWRKENRDAVNRKARERRARIKAYGMAAGYFGTEAGKALLRQQAEATRASKEARALTRRRMLRLYGPRPDGIKLLIKARQAVSLRRRVAGQSIPNGRREFSNTQDRPASSNYEAILAAMRSRHKVERQ